MNSMEQQIKRILEEKVAPELKRHGGNIEFVSYNPEAEAVKVKFHGACQTCPSAQLTLESLVAEHIVSELSQIREVSLVNDLPDDMLDLARKLLKKS